MPTAQEAFQGAKAEFGEEAEEFQELQWEHVPEDTRNTIGAHPHLTSAQVACLVAVGVPSLVLTPILGVLGFGSMGPVAGSAAAWFQSVIGATAAFSALQSAAMGGFGLPLLKGIVQGVSVGVVAIVEWFKWSTRR